MPRSHLPRQPICPERVRKASTSQPWIDRRLLSDAYLPSLSRDELLLYLLLVIVADTTGSSSYCLPHMARLLGLDLDATLTALRGLVSKDLVSSHLHVTQVLALRDRPRTPRGDAR